MSIEPEADVSYYYSESILLMTTEKQKRRRISASKCRSTSHVSPTTSIVERANSQAKLIMTDRRDNLHPETLQMQMLMILEHNKSLWPNESSIQEILDSPDFRDPEIELEESDSEEE